MANNTINQNVNQAIMDFSTIKQAIINKGVSVPTGTPTSQYATKISSIQSGADVSGVTATAEDVDTGKVFVDSTGAEVTGTSTYKADYTALNTLVGQTTATDSDVAQGKVYVKSDGTQSTGTASSGGNQDLIDLIERDVTSITIPDGTTKLGKYAFNYCDLLQTAILPNSVTEIENGVFRNCTSLSTINLPNGLTFIGERSFQNCPSLTSINFPSGLTTIKGAAFMDCTGLTTVTLPNSITDLNSGQLFANCTSLRTVTFLGTPYNNLPWTLFSGCTALTTIRVPWQEGEIMGAPWGAPSATIIYNYTP
jgi:hypothetical protein